MKKGDLVLAHIPFTDFSGEKLRPGLVLVPGNADVILAFITTQIDKHDSTSILISPNETPSTGLKKDSLIRLNRITTLSKNILVGKIGSLPPSKLHEVDNNLRKLFAL